MWTYDDSRSAVRDVLRLSRAMTFKAAVAGLPLGGGKGVIMLRPDEPALTAERRQAVLEDFGETVDALSGSKLPKEITKETFETAKTELETTKATWAEATAAATAGDTQVAADKGRTVQAKGEELKNQLGLNPSLASATPPSAPPAN